MAKDTRKLIVTRCPTYVEFFERFARGMHKRMGEIVRPDRAQSLELMLAICRILEDEWNHTNTEEVYWNLAMEASFYLIASC